MNAEPSPVTAQPYQQDDVIIVQRDGTKRIIRHRRYLARPLPPEAQSTPAR